MRRPRLEYEKDREPSELWTIEETAMADEQRSREEEYFWRKDQELIAKMRRAAAAEQANRELAAKAGLDDPGLVQELAELGFTIDTVGLLPLMPLIQVAWAEGGVSDAERRLIITFARSRGIAEGSAADRQLSAWLAKRPDEQVFARSTRLIRAILASGAPAGASLNPDELVSY